MLKKAGIVVAAAAASLLAVSPLAFAGDKGGHDHGHYDHSSASVSENSEQINSIDEERNQLGLVNVNDNNINVPVQACGNGAVNTATNAVAGNPVLALLGLASLDTVAGDASSSAECTQGGNAGSTTGQVNAR